MHNFLLDYSPMGNLHADNSHPIVLRELAPTAYRMMLFFCVPCWREP